MQMFEVTFETILHFTISVPLAQNKTNNKHGSFVD